MSIPEIKPYKRKYDDEHFDKIVEEMKIPFSEDIRFMLRKFFEVNGERKKAILAEMEKICSGESNPIRRALWRKAIRFCKKAKV